MLRSRVFLAMVGVVLCLMAGIVQGGNQPAQPADRPAPMTDEEFVKAVALGGKTEVELGNLAMQKGASPAVKELGQRLARDHERLNQQLQDIAARLRLQWPQSLDDKHQRIVERFSKMKDGQFDQAFLKDQVDDHEKDVKLFEAKAKNAQDPTLREFATQALPTLREHLKLAQEAQRGAPQKK